MTNPYIDIIYTINEQTIDNSVLMEKNLFSDII